MKLLTTLLAATDTAQIDQVMQQVSTDEQVGLGVLALSALLGMMGHVVKKAKRLQKQAWAAGKAFYGWEYLQKESLTIVSSLIMIAIALLANQEVAQLHVASIVAGQWIVIVFAVIGWMSDSLADWLFGGYEKAIKTFVANKQGLER